MVIYLVYLRGIISYHGLPGRLFFIPAGTKHSFYHINDNYLTKHWIHFKLEFGGEGLQERYRLPLYVDVREDTALVECFQAVNRSCSSTSDELKRNAKLIELFSIYLSLCEDCGSINTAKGSNDFYKVLEFIKLNQDRKLSTQELAGLLHVHPNYFIRLFKSRTGMTPGRYMDNLRCETAKSLLENTFIPISDIMLQAGFEESSAFSHFFRLHTGYSPNEFRKFFGKQE